MRNLINFLLKYNYWFLFIVLEVASFVLLFRFNNYQQSTFFTSANVVVGAVYEVSGGISSYFHLKSVNADLLDRNMVLEQQITNLEKALREHQVDSATVNSIREIPLTDYRLFKAHVIKNSLNQADNYITLDQGSSSGIRPEMGVVDGNGIVGIVYETSSSYSLVISVLNSKSNISCKIVGSDYFGYLKWEHGDSRYAYLKDLPRHAEFNLGDTVVTSGFSTVFPEGIMVGTVDDMSDSHDGLSYLLKIKLATDFGKVSDVRVIARNGQQEQKELEEKNMPQEVGSFTRFPDIIMMDGGRGQVNICLQVLEELGLDIPVCGMVKDDNHRTRGLYFHNVEIPIDRHGEGFKLITRIQDEAHRFAIEYHRSLRSKAQVHSILDDIEGIGPARRKALMRRFQSMENMKNASVEELAETDSMNLAAAQNVYDTLHSGPA